MVDTDALGQSGLILRINPREVSTLRSATELPKETIPA